MPGHIYVLGPAL